MKIIVTGATGMVGSEVVRAAIADSEIDRVVTITRKPLDLRDPKLESIVHSDFLDYSNLSGVFSSSDACIWCLGVSQTRVRNEREYDLITYEFTMAGAKAMLQANPNLTFLFLSGFGADPTMTSRTLFARIKGKTETALRKLPFKQLYIARPAAIQPVRENKHATWQERAWYPLLPIAKMVMPAFVITSEDLAKALLSVVKHGCESHLLTFRNLREIVGRLHENNRGPAH